jgi:hypothetical protein
MRSADSAIATLPETAVLLDSGNRKASRSSDKLHELISDKNKQHRASVRKIPVL